MTEEKIKQGEELLKKLSWIKKKKKKMGSRSRN